MKRLFSYKDRPVHLGPFPLERLARTRGEPDLDAVPAMQPVRYTGSSQAESIVGALGQYAAMLDAIRDGFVKKEKAQVPGDLRERSQHLKSFAYYHDISQAGVCALDDAMFLAEPISNPEVDQLAETLRSRQTSTLAAGIDVVMAELKETMNAPPTSATHHTHALVLLCQFNRDPEPGEPGTDWIQGAQAERATVRIAEVTAVMSNYLRLLGYDARGHTASCSDVDLNRLAVASGLAEVVETGQGPAVSNPFVGTRFAVGAVTTTFALAPDEPLKPSHRRSVAERWRSHGPSWWAGRGFAKNRFNATPYSRRRFKDGAYPFERSKRVDSPTTLIDEPRIPRVPKRTDMFARAIFGDMGKHLQDAARNGNYVRKSATSFASRRALGALTLLQDGPVGPAPAGGTEDEQRNADNVHGALYFLGADAVGISRCPDWVYYSHNALGEPIDPYHRNAISVVVDQGHETMEGASGDDWIACSQSMRAYLRFSLLGGIVAEHIRRLGYGARSHTVIDGEVLQPPLLLLAGLGEVSRIGEVILNPFLGPRLKSGVITTDMPLAYSRPIDFGLQNFCESCNKCARECPSGAITAGPKRMFNGYEIWKSDSQKCTQYRVTQKAGAMCGRCMKTCPWNLEGLFAEAPFRWAATHMPWMAKALAKLDDRLGQGSINPAKKWWWDLEMVDEGPYRISDHGASIRTLQTDLDLKFEDQTLAVYPADLAPHPYPFPFPMNRELGIQAYQEMLSPQEYQERLAAGKTDGLAHVYPEFDLADAPVVRVEVSAVENQSAEITRYEFRPLDGQLLPAAEAGAHLDVVVAPEFFRQYSLSGDPADRSKYQIAVLKENEGRGGSALLHRIFDPGRKVFVSKPINHFPLEEKATRSLLMAGGIGVTPLLAMAHRLHALNKDFQLHYSCRSREHAAFLADLDAVPWAERVSLHFSDDGTRADLEQLLAGWQPGWYLYTCGPDRYMEAVLSTAAALGWPEDALRREYFSVPETPEYDNHDFVLKLAASGRTIAVPADLSATDALSAAGVHVDVKCSDGICGVCQCKIIDGEVEHRDFVLSDEQRKTTMILCQSRAATADGVVEIEL